MTAATNAHSCHWANRALAAPLHRLVAWYGLSQERAALRDLSPDRLCDIGLTQREVAREATRPFWQTQRDI